MSGQSKDFDNGNGLVLNVGIVGAGIAGLTTAAVLSRLGHNVEASLPTLPAGVL
jgi:NADPH-dependent glutamate synthase beta subunit-like oxidoreductase